MVPPSLPPLAQPSGGGTRPATQRLPLSPPLGLSCREVPPSFSFQTSLFPQVGAAVAGSRTFPALSLERLGSNASGFRTSAAVPSPSGRSWSAPRTGFTALEEGDFCQERETVAPGAVTEAPRPPARAQSVGGQRSGVWPGHGLCGPRGVWTLPPQLCSSGTHGS